ncbi:MAG TPA: hypothetical protein PK264_01580, partial [Hyphomicrobiaceae bacterium]|nr:hypothetical protein [Hyphomicrobiaceae bacterium]
MAGSRFAVLPRGMPALLLVAFAGADLAVACAPPPPAVTTIALPRFYADKEGSEVDPKLKAAHAAA